MKKELIFGALLVLGLGMTSCKKEGCTDETATNYSAEAKKDDGSCTFATPEKYVADFKTFYQNKRTAATQVFTIDPTIYNEITGAAGTVLYIPANTFVNASGTLVTSTVTINLLEILDNNDMISLNVPAVSDGAYLISGGELKVTATAGGSPIYVASGSSVGLFVPADSPTFEMGIFDGVEDASGDVTWSVVDSAAIVVIDSTASGYYYSWADSTLGWINCDYFYDDPSPKTTVNANVSGAHVYDNTMVFLHSASLSMAFPLNGASSDVDENSFYSYADMIPIGMSFTVVAISEISGAYYSAFVPITVVADHVENLTLTSTSIAEFEAAVAAL